MPSFLSREALACIVGVCVGGLFTYFFILPQNDHVHDLDHHGDDEYHVHADFHIYIQDEKLDLSDDKFMTTSQQDRGHDAHLHDNDGEIKHIHAEEVTFSSFLDSIGLQLTSECLTTDDKVEHCVEEENVLTLYVNGDKAESLVEYVPVDNDRILLYYGDPNNPKLNEYQEAIPSDSCIYSGTCPERGTAPPESCGLTCEL